MEEIPRVERRPRNWSGSHWKVLPSPAQSSLIGWLDSFHFLEMAATRKDTIYIHSISTSFLEPEGATHPARCCCFIQMFNSTDAENRQTLSIHISRHKGSRMMLKWRCCKIFRSFMVRFFYVSHFDVYVLPWTGSWNNPPKKDFKDPMNPILMDASLRIYQAWSGELV